MALSSKLNLSKSQFESKTDINQRWQLNSFSFKSNKFKDNEILERSSPNLSIFIASRNKQMFCAFQVVIMVKLCTDSQKGIREMDFF